MILTNSIHPILILSFGAALLYSIIAFKADFFLPKWRLAIWMLAWLMHGVAIFYPLTLSLVLFGFGPALSSTAWLVLLVYVLESHRLPQLQSYFKLLLIAVLAVLLAAFFPGKAISSPDDFWQPLHWALGIASYSVFGVAVIHAGLAIRTEQQLRKALTPGKGLPLLTLERLTFHLSTLGFVLLSLTLVMALGLYYVHPEFQLRLNHKTLFGLLSWVVFAIVLAGRFFLGWRGPKALKLILLGALFLFLSYVGSHFVQEVILKR